MKKTVTSMVAALTAIVGISAGSQALAADQHERFVPMYRVYSDLTPADREAVRTHATSTIPTFSGSFSYSGKSYTYIMAGGDPTKGGTTSVPTVILPLKVVVSGTTFDGSSRLNDVLNSPNFKTANYSVGNSLQFQDAVQIAQFYNSRGANWHTTLGTPRVLPTQTLKVPALDGSVGSRNGGTQFGEVSMIWWQGQMTKILKAAGVKPTEIAIVLTDNIVGKDLGQCCAIGYHMSYVKWFVGTQAYAWASYVEPGTFVSTTTGLDELVDVTAISHELAELVNDPFPLSNMNTVPSWEFPGSTKCQFNLETGDPVEVLDNSMFPVVIGTTTYHPQTEAMLQWFERKVPSDAFDSAYSYPDITALTTAAKDCGT